MNFLANKKCSARMRPDACGICLLKQTASGAQSATSPSKIEGFREFEADLSALFFTVSLPAMRVDIYFCNIFPAQMLYC